jgi:hypothetical protein
MAGAAGIRCEFIFNPNWWFRNCGISFEAPFYLDRERRIRDDMTMRRALRERFGIGDGGAEPRPVIGSQFVAGGFVVPALLGVEIRFADNQAPWPVPRELGRDECLALAPPEIETTWPMSRLMADMDALEKEFGYLTGDFDTDGILNTALLLRGQQLFLDMLEDQALAAHLFGVITETQARVAAYLRAHTGTSSVSVNRSILGVDPAIHLHSNCSVQMISPALYANTLLPFERRLAEALPPYGIHHCGNNLHLFAKHYAATGAVFYDVGWGSDVARCSQALLDAFLNLRLSPVRMLQEPAETVRRDTLRLLEAAGRSAGVGVCCINMDYGTPDGNVAAVLRAAEEFAR